MRWLLLALAACHTEPRQAPAPPPAPAPKPVEHRAAAEDMVALQMQLIDSGRLDQLRATFTPDVEVTADAIEACRVRIHQVPVRPDWEMAENSVDESGLHVRRVSMFGKSVTGFHEQSDGRWLADALWCVPVGLP